MSDNTAPLARKSHKRKTTLPGADDTVRYRPFLSKQSEVSSDGRRIRRTTTHISTSHVSASASTSSSSPALAATAPGPCERSDSTEGDRLEHPRDAEPVVHESSTAEERGDNNAEWVSFRSEYLDEAIRYEGRGPSKSCYGCGTSDAPYRCRDQCIGHWLYCRECIIKAHELTPLHWLEEWRPDIGCFRRTSLKNVGQVVQLGHPPCEYCLQPVRSHADFTVINTSGIHIVSVLFCGCGRGAPSHRQQLMQNGWWPASIKNPQTCATFACLRLFHKLNACSKTSVHEFCRALERLTDNTGTVNIKEKRRVFGDIVNQHRHVTMMKRAGRAHVDNGINTTPQGGLAIRCPACPQPGRNLPVDWQAAGPDTSFLYQKFIAQDANFRLANAVRSSEARNPPLGDGLGYFIQRQPYLAYVSSFASEEDISTCSGFAAISLANTKRVRGLRATGVAAVICSRHNMFCNMTYILASAVAHEVVQNIVYSYDVACIFDKNLKDRIATLPLHLRRRIAEAVLRYFVPNFHLPAHRVACHAPYSYHFGPGVGRTHGETLEENWFLLNKSAAQTKPMGPGTRQLTLEDHVGCHNHEMGVSLGRLLPRRLIRTIESYMDSWREYEELRESIEKRDAALVDEWIEAERIWQQDKASKPCPYEFSNKVQRVKDVELALHEQEIQRTADGTPVVQEVTVTAFIKLGIDVQHTQRLLALEQLASIDKLRAWQHIFMPSLQDHLSATELATYNRVLEDVENIAARAATCAPTVASTEMSFRVAEAEECLEDLRPTNQYRQANVRHIGAATRARAAFDRLAKRIHAAKVRYRFARSCLLCLRGPGEWEKQLRVLSDDDVRALNERALTAEEKAQRDASRALARDIDWTADDGVVLAGVVNTGEGSRRLSWIWYTDSGHATVTGADLNEALRVEFLKSKARRDRDREETQLLLEEMRRTIASLNHDTLVWRQRASTRTSADPALRDGLQSYALEQSVLCCERAAVLAEKWKRPREAAQLALQLLFDNIGELTDEDAHKDLEDALDGVDVDDVDDYEETRFVCVE
ncbi:hypothetical protein HDZ31DRAFT_83073 [Schizophyllum fasciatum]